MNHPDGERSCIDATDNWNPPPLIIEYKEDGDFYVCNGIWPCSAGKRFPCSCFLLRFLVVLRGSAVHRADVTGLIKRIMLFFTPSFFRYDESFISGMLLQRLSHIRRIIHHRAMGVQTVFMPYAESRTACPVPFKPIKQINHLRKA